MKTYYFLGIGGIGMSAIARYFLQLGNKVYGYDLTESPLTDNESKEGIEIIYEDNPDLLPSGIDMCIYTPAIPQDNKLFEYFKASNIPMLKRSEVLGEITEGKRCIAISGSHGKTTTTSMIAHILYNSSIGCSAFLGGISKNFHSNFVADKNSDWVVVEADEFDRSFLRLKPEIAAITAIDADHLDIYGTKEELKKAFIDFANLSTSALLTKAEVDIDTEAIKENLQKYTYTIRGVDADYYAINIRSYNGTYYFDMRTPDKIYYDFCLNYGGVHNVENAVLAIAICLMCGATEEEVRKNLATFSGAERRFDVRVKTKNFVYIDDYAHHPKEISTLIESVRMQYPDKKITGVFQPHLYSRTRDFMDEFARSLELLDEVVLLDIYPAREKPLPFITSQALLHRINKMDKYYTDKENLCDLLDALYPQVLLTMGAGDIANLVPKIEKRFANE